VSAHADTVAAPNGLAKAAALKVSISPQALLDINGLTGGLLNSLPSDPVGLVDTLKGALTTTSTIALDDSEVSGTLNAAANDLTAAHSLSSAVLINIAGLDKVLNNLQSLLNGLGVGNAAAITGTLSSLSSLPANLASTLGPVAGVANSLSGIAAPLNDWLNNLGGALGINKTLVADLAAGPQKVSSDLINLPKSGLLQQFSLAPFEATAVNQAQAAANGVTKAMAEAHNSTTALQIGQGLPALGLVDAGTLTNAIDAVGQVLKSLVNTVAPNSSLSQTVTSVVSSLPSALGPAANALTGVLDTVTAQLPGVLGQAAGSVANGTLSSTIDTALGTLKGLVNTLTSIGGLNNMLNGIDLNGIINTNGVTSSAITEPVNGGVHSMASTSFLDVQVLNILGGKVASLLSNTPINGVISNVPVGTPFLEIKGIQSAVDAFVNGTDTTAPTGSTKLAEVDVLGKPIISTDTVLAPGQSITIPVSLGPIGQLTAIVTRGTAQVTSNTPTMKSANASALEVKLLNGDANGQNPLTLLGAAGAGSIVDVGVAQTMVAASMSQPIPVSTPNVPVEPSPLPETGMVGPFGLVAGAVLGLFGLGMNAISRRRRIS